MFYLQNLKKKFFQNFFQGRNGQKIFFSDFSNFSHFFFKKWPQGVLKNIERNKAMEYEHIWSDRQSRTRVELG